MRIKGTAALCAMGLLACSSGNKSSTVVLPTLQGTATLLGKSDWSGTQVSVVGAGVSATTAADGTYSLPNAPLGLITLQFDNGPFHLTLPNVLSLPNSPGFIFAAPQLSELVPVDVPRGQVLANGSVISQSQDASVLLISLPVESGAPPLYEVLTVATGKTQPLENSAFNPILAANGSVVFYVLQSPVDLTFTIKALSTTGGAMPVTLAAGLTSPSYVPAPDGSHVAREVSQGQSPSLEIIPAAGGTPVTTSNITQIYNVGWTLDSSAFVACVGTALQLLPASGAAPVSLTTGQKCPTQVVLDPDGKNILWQDGSGTWTVTTLTGGQSTTLSQIYGISAISSDGQFAVVAGNFGASQAALMSLLSGTMIAPLPNYANSAEFTPDNKSLLFMAGGQTSSLQIIPVTGGEPMTLVSNYRPEANALVFSPDGQTAYVCDVETTPQLIAINLASRQSTVLDSTVAGGIVPSPDGKQIAFTTTFEGVPAIETIPVGGGTPTPVAYGYAITWLDASTLLVNRGVTPNPYGEVNGAYKVPLP